MRKWNVRRSYLKIHIAVAQVGQRSFPEGNQVGKRRAPHFSHLDGIINTFLHYHEERKNGITARRLQTAVALSSLIRSFLTCICVGTYM